MALDWKTHVPLVRWLLETAHADAELQQLVQTRLPALWQSADTDEPDDALLIAYPFAHTKERAHTLLVSGGVCRGCMGTIRHGVQLLNQYFEARQRGEQGDEILADFLLACRVYFYIADEAQEERPGQWRPLQPSRLLVTGTQAIVKALAGSRRVTHEALRDKLLELSFTVMTQLLVDNVYKPGALPSSSDETEHTKALQRLAHDVTAQALDRLLDFIAIGNILERRGAISGDEPVLLGHDSTSGAPVPVWPDDLRRGLYALGKNGTGKSVVIGKLAVGVMEAGQGLICLDPHGDLTDELLARIPEGRLGDVVYLDASDETHAFGANIFECADRTSALRVSETVGRVLDVFEKAFGSGIRLEQYLPNCTKLLMAGGLTLAELPELFRSKQLVDALLAKVPRSDPTHGWWADYWTLASTDKREAAQRRESAVGRATVFLDNAYVRHIVGQPTTVNWRTLMDERRIVLVKLPVGKMQARNVSLIGSLITGQILDAALSREDTPPDQRVPVTFFADEYHRFATPDFARLLDEARKYNIRTVIAHQRRDQLDEAHRDAPLGAGAFFCFGVTPQDAAEVSGFFDLTNPPLEQIGERPVKVFPTRPWDHLIRNGHPNKHIQAMVQLAQEYWLELYHQVELTRGDHQQAGPLSSAGDAVVSAINHYLSLWLTETKTERLERLRFTYVPPNYKMGETLLALHDKLFDFALYYIRQDNEIQYGLYKDYERLGSDIKTRDGIVALYDEWNTNPLGKDRLSLFSETFGPYPGRSLVLSILDNVHDIGDALHDHPDAIRVNSGEMQPDMRPISTAEYQNRLAAQLAALPTNTDITPPLLTARVKLPRGEHTLRIALPARPGSTGRERQDALRIASHQRYYRPRADVEREIAQRLEGDDDEGMATGTDGPKTPPQPGRPRRAGREKL